MRQRHQQTYSIASNLRFTRSGVVYADFLLTGVEYGYRPDEDKAIARTMHKMLLRAVPGESTLLGVTASVNPAVVVERMMRGVDPVLCPAWVEECAATYPTLEEYSPGDRIYWLSVPLTARGWKQWTEASTRAAGVWWAETLGLPRTSIDPAVVADYQRQADKIAATIPAFFQPQKATAAQMVWLWRHSLQRGLYLDTDIPEPAAADIAKSAAAFPESRLDEGAQSDRSPDGLRGKVPSMARVLKVDQPWEVTERPASYQCFLALADPPDGGVLFPGSEFLTLADELPGVDVDWAILLHQRGREEVMKRNQRALVSLNEQFNQRDGELSHGTSVLDGAAADLADYAAEIEGDKNEVEIQATTLFAVGAHSEDLALEYASELAKRFEQEEYRLVQPLGYQEDLWRAMIPGTPRPKIVNEFAQITTSTHFSAFVPVTRNALGDASGPLLALNISSPRVGLVHHDVATKAGADVSGVIGVVGNLGSGKSVALKTIAGNFTDRGGRTVVHDHTQQGEYAAWGATVAGSVIVDPTKPEVSIDPLRIFGPVRGAEIAASIFMPLLQIQPDDDFGVCLTTVLSADYRRVHDLLDGGLYELVGHLETSSPEEFAKPLARKVRVYMNKTYAASVFAPDLPPLDTHAPAIVFRTHTVKLPSAQQLQQQHLYKDLPIEKRFGRAIYSLTGFIAREICFGDKNEPAMWVLDECQRLLAFEEGLEIGIEFVREGRKENAFAAFGSQDPDEGMGNETLRGLIPTKIVMRQTDRILAEKSLAFLGLDPTDPDLLKELMEETSPVRGKDPKTGKEYVEPHRRGEGYMRDAYGNIGRIKILAPSLPSRNAAVMTTPGSRPELVKA